MANKFFRKEIIIGLNAVIAVVILIFGIDYLKGINLFKPANYYYVSYTDVNGLGVSAPVTVNGFKVGQVRDLKYEYDNPGHILVELSLDKNLKVPVGSKAVIKSDILGTATVDLQMPSGGEVHDVGAHIIGETDKGLLSAAGETIMPAVDLILPKIDTLLTSLNAIASNPALYQSITRLDDITQSLNATMKLVNSAVASLPSTMNNVNHATANIDALSANLLTLTDNINELPIKPMMDNLNTTSENLRLLTQELQSPNSTLGLLLHDKALYDNLNATVQSLDSLLTDIKKNPKRYISIKLL